jgi:hypothetical protein
MPLDRTTNYQNSGDFLAGDVNGDFDKIYIGAIQNENEGGRSLRLQDVEPPTAGVDMTIPLKADRLGKFLAFDSTTGGPIALDGSSLYDSAAWSAYDFTGDGSTVAFTLGSNPNAENNTQVYIDGVYQQKNGYSVSEAVLTFSVAPPNLSTIEVMVTTAMNSANISSDIVSYTPAGTGAVSTTVQTKLRETVSVKDFGAVGDGVTDDTAAIQAAIDSNIGSLFFPAGRYKISSTLNILRDNVALIGDNAEAFGFTASSFGSASELLIDTAIGVQVGNGTDTFVIYGLRIENLAFCGTTNCNTAISGSSYKTYCATSEFDNLMFSRDFVKAFYLNPVVCQFKNIRVGESYSYQGLGPSTSKLITCFDFEGTDGVAEGGSARPVNMNAIIECDFRSCDTGVRGAFGNALHIQFCRFETLEDTAVILEGMRNSTISGCYFESMGAATELVTANPLLARSVYTININNNLITNTPNFTALVSGTNSNKAQVISNQFLNDLGSLTMPDGAYLAKYNNFVNVGDASISKNEYRDVDLISSDGALNFNVVGDFAINKATDATLSLNGLNGSTFKAVSTGAGLGAGTVIGAFLAESNDASAPGPGIKGGIEIKTQASLGDDAEMIFYVSTGTVNKVEAARLKYNKILNLSYTPTYADNTTALAGGLVAGDVYRTATGQLMIAY